MTLTDGRGELYQWDTGRTLTVDDATVTQVHFQNRAYGRTIDVDVKDGSAIIPDELLQKAGDLRVYAFSGTAASGFTKVERVFNIVRRNKPNDYMFTPTEQKSLEGLQKQIGDLSDLKTDAKSDIVAAINETATAGQTLGLTGATVGQVPAVKAVDGNGAPTEWEAVELPSGAYTVNLTMDDGGNITADKTFAEIKAAHDDGKVVNAKFAGAIVPLLRLGDSVAVFTLTGVDSGVVFTADLTCASDNVWSWSQIESDAFTLGISGASVGQTVKIKAVDKNGIPPEWEAVDDALPLLYHGKVSEEISGLEITEIDGNPMSLSEVKVRAVFKVSTASWCGIELCTSAKNPNNQLITAEGGSVFTTAEKYYLATAHGKISNGNFEINAVQPIQFTPYLYMSSGTINVASIKTIPNFVYNNPPELQEMNAENGQINKVKINGNFSEVEVIIWGR